ncbi:D-alanyl-D-alanine carboxypeptidase [Aquabacter spiritensis]|uniref:D-alanyl-D-alanine carboxypeptidase n=2 Tax=Aquabacter spiritensis TaxID=933073 RepID=A0A4R3LQ74_9HYPH|nr:D-alanyl-D-alanine carboxypeptidase [Aquabacter spiritensis]
MRMALAHGTLPIKLLSTALAAALCLSASFAEAKPRKQSKAKSSSSQVAKSSTSGSGWRSGQSAIIVDGNTGKVLYDDNADALRHPASVTKVMTLYLLFEQLDAGRLNLDSDLPVSQRAAAQSPSKLNVRPGSTIEVEDAIKALVTRSANDVAVVIAEAVGGSESNFAAQMTRKARALGMSNTTFRNASGLPDRAQVTTARDLATLGIAIQDRFPRYYKYFSTRSFTYKGQTIAGHNRMFGRIEGVDGIKTGYTRASGFNLLTSVHDEDRFLIGVVMGGSSGASRDTRMAQLINTNMNRAYAGRRVTPKVTEVAAAAEPPPIPAPAPVREAKAVIAPLPTPQRLAYAADPVTTAAIAVRTPPAGSTEPIKPVAVKTVPISRPMPQALPAPTFAASGGPVPPAALTGASELMGPPPNAPIAAVAPAIAAPVAAPLQPVRTASAGPVTLPAAAAPASIPPAPTSAPRMDVAKLAAAEPKPARTEPAAAHRPGWMIQIGAFGAEREAKARLDLAQAKAKSLLGGAEPYTEKVTKGSSDLYRARFAGLDEKGAKEACRLLQRNDFACMTLRN